MTRNSILAAAAGLLSVLAAASAAQALPLAKARVSPQWGAELVAQKSGDDDTRKRGKSEAQRASDKKDEKGRAPRYGSRAPGTSIPLTARGTYLYGPSFNGAYTPPAGYSFSGYPIRYADEVDAAQAECAPLRRRALSSGQRSSWDRYYACMED